MNHLSCVTLFRGFSYLATLAIAVVAPHPFGVHALAAPLRIVTSTTDLAWSAREIGGPLVRVESLLKGTEDPHYVDARPDFVAKVSRADIVCVVGLDLEVGWMPKVLSKSGHAQVQPGGKGYCNLGKKVEALDKLDGPVDRSMGDLHPAGNPHFWLSPTAFAQASEEIKNALIRVDPKNEKDYEARYTALSQALSNLQAKLKAKLEVAGVRGESARIFEYHREFSYFVNAYHLKSEGSIEEKPGIAPSAGRLVFMANEAKTRGIKVILASETAPRKLLTRFEELSGLQVTRVPVSVQKEGSFANYLTLQEHLTDEIVKAHQTAMKESK